MTATISRRVWLITGAGGGFGRSLVRQLLERGEYVAAADRSLELLAALPSSEDGCLFPVAIDLTDPDDHPGWCGSGDRPVWTDRCAGE
ncbi:MAG: hypothetical protein KatS3mg056_0999 [Chloroflexus sp.]|nr:MAG: hypothetical protein KatS3mg056_0999 [Chloroflexus sp.]